MGMLVTATKIEETNNSASYQIQNSDKVLILDKETKQVSWMS